MRDVYLTDDPNEAAVLLDRVIAGFLADKVEEIVSLGNTLRRWRTQILAHHLRGASNGPTETMNLLVKKIKRCGHGFKSFRNYRLRVLLHCGGIQWRGCCTNPWDRVQIVGRRHRTGLRSVARALDQLAQSRSRLWVALMSFHSVVQAASPRQLKREKPRTYLWRAKTGSIITFLRL